MKYLITGHKGFIGKNLVDYLYDRFYGVEVTGCDRPYELTVNTIFPDADVVVHLAAETNVRESIEDPEKVFLDNCKMTFNALNHARKINARFIFASSCGASNPSNPYTASKIAGEALCTSFNKSFNTKTTILRFANVYGPHSAHKDSVVSKFIRTTMKGDPITIYGDGEQRRDFIHVEDICKAICEVESAFATIATGHSITINQLVEKLRILSVVSAPIIPGELISPDSPPPWAGCEVSLDNGLASTLKWFEENYK